MGQGWLSMKRVFEWVVRSSLAFIILHGLGGLEQRL